MNTIQVNPKKEKTISKKKHQTITTITTYIFFFFTKHKGESKNHTLKKTVGVWVSNLRVENDTWSQLSILYKIKIGSKLIKEKNKEQK